MTKHGFPDHCDCASEDICQFIQHREASALAPHAPAQSQLDALREEVARLKAAAQESALQYLSDNGQWIEEVARLTKERDKLEFAMGGWKAMMWAVARELNCLPSTFWDGNAHVLKAAIKLNVELAALKAQPTDVDALMALADAYSVAKVMALRVNCRDHDKALDKALDTAREALRAKLAARKELT